jgi:hypothetical protein
MLQKRLIRDPVVTLREKSVDMSHAIQYYEHFKKINRNANTSDNMLSS